MSKVIVLGGVGFIGRNLVKYLVDSGACSKIRVVDKVLPNTAFLGEIHQKAMDSDVVEYMQGNLTSAASIEKVFTQDVDGDWDYVINLAAETKYGQTEAVYDEKVLDLAKKCGAQAAKGKIKKFVQVSTAQVYEPKKSSSDEKGKISPWTNLAKYSLEAEKALADLGLPLVIVRPAIVYGPGDILGISPRLIAAMVYKHLGEKMKYLWSADLKINTVHVEDAAAALWTIAEKAEPGSVYNLADSADTTQGSLNKIIEEVFGIKTGFQGTALSTLAAKAAMDSVTEIVNDKHLKPWSEVCKANNIVNTPLTPYLDQELLLNNSLSVKGDAVTSLGFKYKHPKPTADLIRDQLDYFIKQGLFPKI